MKRSLIYKSKYLNCRLKVCYSEDGISQLFFLTENTKTTNNKFGIADKVDLLGKKIINELDSYFSGKNVLFKFKFDTQGTAMQLKVWRTLCKIPFGQLISYADLAKKAGHAKAIRAVASAVGKNPIPVIIPCHRVIRSSGEIGQYSGGVSKKISLIKLESDSY